MDQSYEQEKKITIVGPLVKAEDLQKEFEYYAVALAAKTVPETNKEPKKLMGHYLNLIKTIGKML